MPASILITRPAASAAGFVQALKQRVGPHCDIVVSPLLRIEPIDCDLDLATARTLIFTSVHSVEAFSRLSKTRDRTCYTVGPATAKAAQNAGFAPITGGGTGLALVDRIQADAPPSPCLYLRGDHVAFDIANALNKAGIETHSHVIYHQVAQPLSTPAERLLNGKRRVILPIFSPRSAEIFFEQGPFGVPLHVVALSENVAQRVPDSMVTSCVTAQQPDQPSMLNAISDLWLSANRLEGRDPAQ